MDFLYHTKGLALFMELLIKSSLICGFVLVLSFLFRKQSASFRHLLLGVAMMGLLVLPLTIVFAPGWNTGIQVFHPEPALKKTMNNDVKPQPVTRHTIVSQPGENTTGVVPVPAKKTRLWHWLGKVVSYGLIFLWVLGVLCSMTIVFIGIYGTLRLTGKGVPLEGYPWKQLVQFFLRLSPIRRKVRLIQSSRCVVPMTCGVISPAVVVPHDSGSWTLEQCSSVLFHELAHVKRLDFPLRVLARMTCAFYWFNPLCWQTYRFLKREQEKACDEMVLKMGIKPSKYASHLLELRRVMENNMHFPSMALGIADKAEFKDRLVHILKKQINLKEVKVKTKVLIMIIGMVLVLFIGTAKVIPAFSSTPMADEKLEKNVQQWEKEVMNIKNLKQELARVIDEQKKNMGKQGEKEQLKNAEMLELKLEKMVQAIDVTAEKIEKTLDSETMLDEVVAKKLEDKLEELEKMERDLEEMGAGLEAVVAEMEEKTSRLQDEQLKQLEAEAQKMELESQKLDQESQKLEQEAMKMEEEARLMEEKLAEETDLEVQKKLEEELQKLEKEAAENELQEKKLDEEAKLLEEQSRVLEEKMEALDGADEPELPEGIDELEKSESEEKDVDEEPLGDEEEESSQMDDEVDRARQEKELQRLIAADQKSLKMKDARMFSIFIARGQFTKAQIDRFKQAVLADKGLLPANFEVVVDIQDRMSRVGIYCPEKESQSKPGLVTQLNGLYKKYMAIFKTSPTDDEVEFSNIFND